MGIAMLHVESRIEAPKQMIVSTGDAFREKG
jgi:hypothetical protein